MIHAWHPGRSHLCPEQPDYAPATTVVESVTCPDCLALLPATGAERDGVLNDAGVLRRVQLTEET